jgi:hypothetical protein
MLSISKIAREKMESVCREARVYAEEELLNIGFDGPFKELHIANLATDYLRGYLNEAKEIITRMKEKECEPQLISDIVEITIEEIEMVKDYLYL